MSPEWLRGWFIPLQVSVDVTALIFSPQNCRYSLLRPSFFYGPAFSSSEISRHSPWDLFSLLSLSLGLVALTLYTSGEPPVLVYTRVLSRAVFFPNISPVRFHHVARPPSFPFIDAIVKPFSSTLTVIQAAATP